MKEYIIAAFRGRDLIGGGREQQLEISTDECSHAITSVSKDNLIIERESMFHERIRGNKTGNQTRL